MVSVKVLGSGCAKCDKLFSDVDRAIATCGVPAQLAKVSAIPDIASYGVMMTPALVVDEQVVSTGRIPTQAQLTNWLTTAAMKREG